jgi:hypothetical protein
LGVGEDFVLFLFFEYKQTNQPYDNNQDCRIGVPKLLKTAKNITKIERFSKIFCQ